MARRELRFFAAALFALCVACPAAAIAQSGGLDEQAFAQDMLARLRKAEPGSDLRIKPDEPLVIQVRKGANWDEASYNLHRVYGFCQVNSDADCEAVKADYVDKITRPLPVTERRNLRVIVRDQQYLDYILSVMKTPDTQPVYRRIGDDLYAIMAIDAPDSTSIANSGTLEKLGMDADAAWTLAMRQTRDVLPPFPNAKLAHHEPVLFEGYEYLASLLAFADEWNAAAQTAGPDMFVTAVSDNLVFVGFFPKGDQLEQFRQAVIDDCNAQPRCISPNVYRLREGRWVIDR